MAREIFVMKILTQNNVLMANLYIIYCRILHKMGLSTQILTQRLYFQNRYENITPELMVKGAWVSTAFALILTIPALLSFIGVYHATASVVLGALLGFSIHFLTLAFATRVTGALEALFN